MRFSRPQGKNPEMVCHSLLQWNTFCQNSPPWPVHLGWPCMSWYMIYSVYKLNKQSDNKQPCHTPSPILNQSVVPFRVLTVASWLTYSFLRRQVRWPGLRVSHSLLGSTQRLYYSQWNRGRCFSEILLPSLWSSKCWQFDLWFLCLF